MNAPKTENLHKKKTRENEVIEKVNFNFHFNPEATSTKVNMLRKHLHIEIMELKRRRIKISNEKYKKVYEYLSKCSE